MLQKGFLSAQRKSDTKQYRIISVASRMMLYIGILILIFSLIYMSVNLAEADMIINIWLPFMIAGVLLVFISMLMQWSYRWRQGARCW